MAGHDWLFFSFWVRCEPAVYDFLDCNQTHVGNCDIYFFGGVFEVSYIYANRTQKCTLTEPSHIL